MRLAITQPAYLPWAGYFDLMDQADTFVLLDCVQLSDSPGSTVTVSRRLWVYSG